MWAVGLLVVGALVAGYVGRAMMRDLVDDWRWTQRVRKTYAVAGAGGNWRERGFARRQEVAAASSAAAAGIQPILGGQGIVGEGSRKLKRE
jgi:hypothetical protein